MIDILQMLVVQIKEHFEGGEFYSESLRKYYMEKYSISAGLYTYGCFNPSFNFGGGVLRLEDIVLSQKA